MTLFDELSLQIPAYIRGELSDAERDTLEGFAQSNPDFQAEIDMQKALGGALKASEDPFEAQELGWARLSAELEQNDREADRAPQQFWRYAAAILAVVCVTQAGFLGSGFVSGEDAHYQPVSETSEAVAALSLGFKDTATDADIRALLRDNEAQIFAGPSSLGLYKVGFDSHAQCQTAVENFVKQDKVVATVSTCE